MILGSKRIIRLCVCLSGLSIPKIESISCCYTLPLVFSGENTVAKEKRLNCSDIEIIGLQNE